jgi:Mg2+ and Co2+ transporter CorA
VELDSAQLSALSTSLSDLVDRVTRLADRYQGSPREDVAADLYDVERHLQAADRRLRALLERR